MANSINISLLNISHYLIKLSAKESARLPAFLGSTLRGAFGHSLKATVCIVNHRDCNRCIVADRCVYPYLFETSAANENNNQQGNQLPHPFVLTPPLLEGSKPGDYQQFKIDDELVFELTLMGKAIDYLPYVIYSVSQMAEKGFGLQNRSSFKLLEVFCLDSEPASKVYDYKTEKLATPNTTKTLADLVEDRLESLLKNNLTNITLKFFTPTRIRVDKDLQAEISFSLLVKNIIRRMLMLSKHHGQTGQGEWLPEFSSLIQLAESVQTTDKKQVWWDFERYSNRQQTYMKLGGFVGEINYSGIAINALLPLIVAGEFLHIGSNTSFGLGKYKILQ
jgi:hypothetical protein